MLSGGVALLGFNFMKSLIALLGWGMCLVASGLGAESRSWVVRDGGVVVGTLQKVAGNTVFIVDGEGKVPHLEQPRPRPFFIAQHAATPELGQVAWGEDWGWGWGWEWRFS